MRSFKSRLLAQLAFAFAAAVAFATNGIAANPSTPFQAVLTINERAGVDPTGTCPALPTLPTGFRGEIAGTGNASHLGKVTLSSSDCILLVGTNGFFFFSTQFVLTAANGDQMYGKYQGALGSTPASPVPQISGTFEVTGGNGRFAGATGSGVIDGYEDINFSTGIGQGQIRLTGSIAY